MGKSTPVSVEIIQMNVSTNALLTLMHGILARFYWIREMDNLFVQQCTGKFTLFDTLRCSY